MSDDFQLGYKLGNHIVNACLQLNERNINECLLELNKIGEYFEELKKFHTSNIEPLLFQLHEIEEDLKSQGDKVSDQLLHDLMTFFCKTTTSLKSKDRTLKLLK